jgi:hypothetical protein
MCGLAKIFAVIAVCLGVTGSGWASNRPPRAPGPGPSQPVAYVWAPREPLHFGMASGPRSKQLQAETKVHVLANCPFRLAAAFGGLTEEGGRLVSIDPRQVRVTINGAEVPIGTDRVAIARGGPTPPSGVDVPLVIVIELKSALAYPAGRYGGNLAVAVLKGS